MYKITNTLIPQNKRKELNEKILYLIDNNLTSNYGITAQDVYSSYTGEGGLHGLSFNDYDSFHSFTEAKKLIEVGQFFTPHNVSKFIVDCVKPSNHDLIADLTCGHGSFFNWLPNQSNVYGCELDIKAVKVSKFLYTEANITADDIRSYDPQTKFDIIFGNPPFNLKWNIGRDEYLSQLYYCIKAHELLKPAGIMALIVPSSFLSDDFTDSGMIKNINNRFNFIFQAELPSNVFKNVGVDNFKTKIMFFQKQSEHITAELPYNTAISPITELNENRSSFLHNTYIKPIVEQKEKVKHKLFFEQMHHNSDDLEFQVKITKYLFDIKRNKNINNKYAKCVEYVSKYHNQVKPEGMKYDEWEKVRITKPKVISYLKRIIKNQHVKEHDSIKLVKTNYGLRMKGYSHKTKLQLSKLTITKDMSFNDMILNNSYPFEDETFKTLYNSKRKKYQRQSEPFKNVQPNTHIKEWLNNLTLYNQFTDTEIRLTDIQKNDMGLILQKPFGILNFQQGSGKTECSIAWFKYLLEHKPIRNVFVVSSAISIKMTWCNRLEQYNIPYVKIDSLKDIKNIKKNDIVLITFNMLTKYQKQLKKYIKQQSQKVALVVDESHRLSNPKAKRTQSTLSVFRRVKYKLLASGTLSRNNINELFSQLELVYNNSLLMLNECEEIQKEDQKTKELRAEKNKYYMKPFPAYDPSLFKSCFSPVRASVFGVSKQNQDIYNSSSLVKLIERSTLTRKFKEIAGDNKYEIITHRIEQNENEREVYRKIMEEFYEMIPRYFSSTGNSRKDSILRLIRQIQLMIKATSQPQSLKEYNGFKEPNKYKYIESLVGKFNEKIIIGTVFVDSAAYYYNKLRNNFKDRKVFLILGDVSFKKRIEIIKEFEAEKNAILVCTQTSLSESVSIPSCNKVIVEALQWNMPCIEQFYFRAIRYNSAEKTDVHFVTYKSTIEQNIMALIMVKEQVNNWVKTLDYIGQEEIFEEYGIDLDLLNNLIEKTYEEDGSVKLSWGEQVIV